MFPGPIRHGRGLPEADGEGGELGLHGCGGGPSVELTADPKHRLQWTAELHDRFVDAVAQLGGPEKAKPKAIMRTMGVKGITLFHLKSRLQKYRLGRQSGKELTVQSKDATKKLRKKKQVETPVSQITLRRSPRFQAMNEGYRQPPQNQVQQNQQHQPQQQQIAAEVEGNEQTEENMVDAADNGEVPVDGATGDEGLQCSS